MSNMQLQQKAYDIVDEVVSAIKSFPPDVKAIEKAVDEVIDGLDYGYEDRDFVNMMSRDLWLGVVPALGDMSPLDAVNAAIRVALREEAQRYIDGAWDDFQRQESDWGVLVEVCEDFGIPCTYWEPFDFIFLDDTRSKLAVFASAVYDYIDAPSERLEAAAKNLATAQPASLGLPTSTDADDWMDYWRRLSTVEEIIEAYVADWGGTTKLIVMRLLWEDITAAFHVLKNNLDPNDDFSLKKLKWNAERLGRLVEEYLEYVDY